MQKPKIKEALSMSPLEALIKRAGIDIKEVIGLRHLSATGYDTSPLLQEGHPGDEPASSQPDRRQQDEED